MDIRSWDGPGLPDRGRDAIMSERPRLINVAYRLLGSLADAEDVVQEAFARWYARSPSQQEAIESPHAWLTTVTSRLCFDQLRAPRRRRERYVGAWIPEPLPEPTEWSGGPGDATDPAEHVTLDESVSMAFLVVLDAMTPAERVSFILHDVFRYPFAQVAEIVGRTPAACRQLASSARRRLDDAEARSAQLSTERQVEIIRLFKSAWAAKDVGALVKLLDPDATATADGGGRALAAPAPIRGAEEVARHYITIAKGAPEDVLLDECEVNGRPGLVMHRDGVAATVFAFDMAGNRIRRIWAVRNPDKLRAWRRR